VSLSNENLSKSITSTAINKKRYKHWSGDEEQQLIDLITAK
jgi:hypothetical protein